MINLLSASRRRETLSEEGDGEYPTMATEMENTDRVGRVIEEAFNRGKLDVINDVMASDYVCYEPSVPEEIRGPEEFKEYVQMNRTAFPDLTLSLEDRVVEGNKIADRYTSRGTHEGEFRSIAPTGNEFEGTVMVIHYFEDGKCVADYALTDALGLLSQLGVVEPPGE
jgi:predicted ester cyclase